MVVGSSIACKGDGTGVGLTDGNYNYGFYQSLNGGVQTARSAYDRGTLPVSGNNFNSVPYDYIMGITTDGTKSGIVSDLSGLPATQYIIKF